MTIRKGEDWGILRVCDAGLPTVASDAELHEFLSAAVADGPVLPVVGVCGGDLMRTVGGTGNAARFVGGEPIPHLPIDLIHVVADDIRETIAVAHLVARRRWLRGPLLAVMNAQFLSVGSDVWDVAPRAHPNDGRFDRVTVGEEMSLQQRWMARRRVRLGTHVPHPHINIRQQSEATIDFDRATPIWIDGVRWGSARKLALFVQPDAAIICV